MTADDVALWLLLAIVWLLFGTLTYLAAVCESDVGGHHGSVEVRRGHQEVHVQGAV